MTSKSPISFEERVYTVVNCSSCSLCAQKDCFKLKDLRLQTFWSHFHLPCVDGRLLT